MKGKKWGTQTLITRGKYKARQRVINPSVSKETVYGLERNSVLSSEEHWNNAQDYSATHGVPEELLSSASWPEKEGTCLLGCGELALFREINAWYHKNLDLIGRQAVSNAGSANTGASSSSSVDLAVQWSTCIRWRSNLRRKCSPDVVGEMLRIFRSRRKDREKGVSLICEFTLGGDTEGCQVEVGDCKSGAAPRVDVTNEGRTTLDFRTRVWCRKV